MTLVKQVIKANCYTITISCGKLTTGVTMPEWTAVMMLTGSASTAASGYMQTIFRVQSAGVLDGKQKERCYGFDDESVYKQDTGIVMDEDDVQLFHTLIQMHGFWK